jgi:peptide/nickel transport system substrate-binding protein
MGTNARGINRRTFLIASGAAGISLAQLRHIAAQNGTGSVRIGVSEDGYRVDERANVGFYPLNTNIFESLVYMTPNYEIEPMLAESWEFVEPNTWRITLRQGVTFHDGTPFTAEAVKYSMDRIAANGGGVLRVDENSTVIVDDYTVEITPSVTNRRFMDQVGHPNDSILPPGLNPAESRVGTGPFREVEYVQGDHYTVEANPEYWGEAPGVSEITFRFYADPTARMLALQAGDVDMIVDVPKESASQVEATGATLVTGPVGAYQAMYFQIHGAEPYDLGQDRAVREAVSIAIDRQQIIDNVWQGFAEAGTTMIPPAILGEFADMVETPEYDAEAAKTILEDAGWVDSGDGIREKDGRRLSLTLINGYGTAADHGSTPEVIQAQLAEIGVEVEIVETPDTATYEQRLAVGEGDLWLERGSQNDANPAFLPDLLFTSPVEGGDPESTMYGRAFAPGEAFDTAITEAREAVEREQVQEAAARAMNIVIGEERVVIPLCGMYSIAGTTDAVTAFDQHASGVNQRWTSVETGE